MQSSFSDRKKPNDDDIGRLQNVLPVFVGILLLHGDSERDGGDGGRQKGWLRREFFHNKILELQSRVKTFMPGSGNGWLKCSAIVHCWGLAAEHFEGDSLNLAGMFFTQLCIRNSKSMYSKPKLCIFDWKLVNIIRRVTNTYCENKLKKLKWKSGGQSHPILWPLASTEGLLCPIRRFAQFSSLSPRITRKAKYIQGLETILVRGAIIFALYFVEKGNLHNIPEYGVIHISIMVTAFKRCSKRLIFGCVNSTFGRRQVIRADQEKQISISVYGLLEI